jgi:orotidine-5'-phosphate decarboxylase
MTEDKIIVALDVPARRQALELVEKLWEQISFFKIGLQLYTAEGPEIVRSLIATGAKVFFDVKLHDIPNSVGRAVEAASKLSVQMLSIHLSGGSDMIRTAVAARATQMSILGVTVLTSLDEEALREIAITDKTEDHVVRLARLGVQNGIDGIVASPREIRPLREEFGNRIKIVVPGVRPTWSETSDQKRTMTPREAIDAGADYLVIGRPITAHQNPREAVEKISGELS